MNQVTINGFFLTIKMNFLVIGSYKTHFVDLLFSTPYPLFGKEFFKVIEGFSRFKTLELLFGRIKGFLKYGFWRILKISKSINFSIQQIN